MSEQASAAESQADAEYRPDRTESDSGVVAALVRGADLRRQARNRQG